MKGKENKLSCKARGPGPAYKLKTLTGYIEHDPSKYRHPAYSMTFRKGSKVDRLGPGPRYDTSHRTRFGIYNSPAYTLGMKTTSRIRDTGPGPGAYRPEACPLSNHESRAPAYTMAFKGRSKFADNIPGPNAYSLPTCLGPKIPDKRAQGAYSMAWTHGKRVEAIGPGPAAYPNIQTEVFKTRFPAYSMKFRPKTDFARAGISPGPQYYCQFNTKKNPPMFSFGLKHSECTVTAMTEYDNSDD